MTDHTSAKTPNISGDFVETLVRLGPALEHLAPLLQTLAWILFTLILLWSFRKPIGRISHSIEARIATGSAVKAWGFELPEFSPQDSDTQRRKLEEEVSEVVADDSTSRNSKEHSASHESIHQRYLQAEDLAMKALQIEVKTPISRSVSLGDYRHFDGVFVKDKTLNIVEIKFFTGSAKKFILVKAIENVLESVDEGKWKNYQIHLGVVLEKEEFLEHSKKLLRELHDQFPKLIPHLYVLGELQIRFVESED